MIVRTLARSSSGHVALFWFRFSSCFITPSMPISRRGGVGVSRGGYLGDGVLFVGKYRATLVYSYFNVLHTYSRVQLLQCVKRILSCTFISICYTRTLMYGYFNVFHAYTRYSYFNVLHPYSRYSYFNVLHAYSRYSYFVVLHAYTRVQLVICATCVLSCTATSMFYMRTLVYCYFNVLHAYSHVLSLRYVTHVLSCSVTSMCYHVLSCTISAHMVPHTRTQY